MDVRCDRCETEYELDDAIVTDAGASVQCTTCGHTFIVTRRPPSPLSQVGFTPPSGLAQAVGPEVPEWTLSTEDGKIHRFRDLNTLQKWIVERKVTRNEKISRAGGSWLALGDVVELAPFFSVIDEADRARATGAPHPTSPGRAVSSSSAARPIQGSAPSLTRPPEGQKPISEDGPTVPNRRLPGMADPPRSAVRPSDAQSSAIPAPGLRTPDRRPSDARGSAGQGVGPPTVRSTTGTARPIARTEMVAAQITEEISALEADFLRPRHAGRNLMLGLIALGVVGGGGYWWWTEQHDHAKSAEDASPKLTPGSVTPTPPAVMVPRLAGAGGTAAVAVGAATPGPSPGLETGTSRAGASDKPAAPGSATGTPSSTVAMGATASSGRSSGLGDSGDSGASGASPARARDGIPAVAPAPGRSAARADAPAPRTGSYDRMVADADRLLERGKSAKADKLYGQALVARPDGVEALTGSAYVLLDRQRHFKAIETFRRALAIQPGFGPALFGIAESYRARGDMAQALGAYRQYLAITPSGTDAPAARRQIKDLESAGSASTSERSAQESPPASGQDR